jgi:hypothetical protein
MQTTQTIENVTLSLPNTDMAMLRLLSKRMGWKVKVHRKSGLEKALEDEAAGRVFEAKSFEDLIDQIEAQSTTPPPCQYTVDEAVQRVLQATADVDAGRGLMAHEEFEKLVRSWY